MNDQNNKLQQWKIDPPNEALLHVIVSKATKQQQKANWVKTFKQFGLVFFSDWQFAAGYKLATFSTCALLGFLLGWQQPTEVDIDFTVLAFAMSLE